MQYIGNASLLASGLGFKPSSGPDAHDVSAKAGELLYNEQGTDNWSGWSLGGEWKTLHNVLLSDGTASSSSYGSSSDTIWSPHVVGVANYALDAKIQITSPQENCYFGLVGRSSTNSSSSGYVAGLATGGYPPTLYEAIAHYSFASVSASSSSYINRQQYNPGAGAHTYHVEFVDTHITMKIDNGNVMGVTDSISLDGGLVGLESSGCQLAISNFSIKKL